MKSARWWLQGRLQFLPLLEKWSNLTNMYVSIGDYNQHPDINPTLRSWVSVANLGRRFAWGDGPLERKRMLTGEVGEMGSSVNPSTGTVKQWNLFIICSSRLKERWIWGGPDALKVQMFWRTLVAYFFCMSCLSISHASVDSPESESWKVTVLNLVHAISMGWLSPSEWSFKLRTFWLN